MDRSGRISEFKFIILRLTAFLFVLASVIFAPAGINAYAAGIRIESVNYDKSEITVQLGAQDNLVMISDAKQKKWEIIPVEKDSNNYATLDISWISAKKDYVLSLKGDVSSDPVKVTIPKQVTNFKATYNMLSTNVTFSGEIGGRSIQWRKKEGLTWNNYNPLTFPEELSGFCANGAVVYFRLAPVNGVPGERPSKEVYVNVPKKTEAPKITVNDAALTIAVAKGMQYRYLETENGNPKKNADGSYVDWIDVNTTHDMLLKDLAPQAFYSSGSPEKVYVQFRTKATSSKQMSSNTSVTIPEQQAPIRLTAGNEEITLKYTSSTTFQLQVLYASSDHPYEYCILDSETLNGGTTIADVEPQDIKWETVSSTTPITFGKDKDDIEEGSLVYVRKKALKSLGDDNYKLASEPMEMTGMRGIEFPGDVKPTDTDGFTWLQSIAGICNQGNAEGHITFEMYSPTETTIKTLTFVDYNNLTSYGDVEVTSSVARNAGSTGTDDKYIITTTIKSTDGIDSHTKTRMLAYITFASGSVYKSTPQKGVGLYLYPATEVDNPEDIAEKKRIGKLFYGSSYDYDNDYVEYSDDFRRVYMSNKVYGENANVSSRSQEDARSFKFLLRLGTIYKKQLGTLGSSGRPDLADEVYTPGAANQTIIDKIKYDGVVLPAGCYTVQYVADKGSKNEDVLLALVTVNAKAIEEVAEIDERDSSIPLVVYLNNGEILEDDIKLNLTNTATVDEAPKSWTLTAGSLVVEKEIETTDSNNNKVITKEKVYDYEINLTLFSPSYSVSVTDVTWNGISVYDKATVSGGKIKIYLSNEKINKIAVDSSTLHNLEITFSNGFVINDSSKCSMTILKSAQ